MKLKYKLGCLFIMILFALLVLVIQLLTMSYIEIANNGLIIISFFSLAFGIYMYEYIMSKISSGLSLNEEETSNGTNKKLTVKKIIVGVSCFIPLVLFLSYCYHSIKFCYYGGIISTFLLAIIFALYWARDSH